MRVSGWLYLLQQTSCSLGLLLALGQATGLSRHAWPRLVLTAMLTGSATLVAARIHQTWLRAVLLLPLLLLAPRAAWPGLPHRLRLPLALKESALTLSLSGLARFTENLGLPRGLIVPSSCLLLCLVTPLMRRSDPPRCVTVDIRHNNRRLTLTALIDSGNLLQDAVTGLPVIVISRQAASQLTLLPQPGHLSPGMRLMSVRTVAGSALMVVFRPSAVFLENQGAWRAVNAIVGLSPDGYEGFQALVPASLISAVPFSDASPVSGDALLSAHDP